MKIWRKLAWLCLLLFVLVNVISIFHAYRFVHYVRNGGRKESTLHMSTGRKLVALFTGVRNPRPKDGALPQRPYRNLIFTNTKGDSIAAWEIRVLRAKGTIILFHGYGAGRSSLLLTAQVFNQLGYNTLLVDFRGSGASSGSKTSIGWYEADDVKTVCDSYKPVRGPIILCGTSMGAAAIMRAVAVKGVQADKLILECPFSTLLATTRNRFRVMGVPPFPLANLLVFWGGAIDGYWAFSNKPEVYARSISIPVLLMYGEKDPWIKPAENQAIFNAFVGTSTLKTFPNTGHESYCAKYPAEWLETVRHFLER